jgi:hypothetical protein
MKKLRLQCIETSQYKEFSFIFKNVLILVIFLHWNIQAFTWIFGPITCLGYQQGGLPIFVTKNIGVHYRIYSLIIIIIAKICSIRCAIFKMSKVSHWTMFLPLVSLLVRLQISIYPNINNLGANTNKGWLQVKENNKMEKNFENQC